MDAFVVHGGLGTTVEALRMRKPTVVTGILLMDQRFWGLVCHEQGIGPKPVHIGSFKSTAGPTTYYSGLKSYESLLVTDSLLGAHRELQGHRSGLGRPRTRPGERLRQGGGGALLRR